YQTPVSERFLIFTRRGIKIEDYPAILKHLEQFKDRLMPKPKDWKGEWAGRKEGTYQWYEIQDSIDYWKEFEKAKVVYQEIMTYQAFSYDSDRIFTNNKIFILPDLALEYLGILNSQIVWFYLNQVTSKLQGGALAMQSPYVLSIPIPPISKPVQSQIESLVTRILALKKSDPAADTSALESEIDQLVYGLYGLTEEEVAVVEGAVG
ncbi:MAG: TaqI-like C-terminal specificity domain-containing protein, partial [Saprospiraceae bacterium]